MLPQYVRQPAKLKRLVVTCDYDFSNFARFAFPHVTHLAQLTTLEIQAEAWTAYPHAELIRYNLSRCPETLKHVILDGLYLARLDGHQSEIQQVLGSALASLTCLELKHCRLSLAGRSMSCLAHLQSLSFQGSQVWGDACHITTLTSLTLLDLSGSVWNQPHHHDSIHNDWRIPVMIAFTAWSALEVLKLSYCSLFDGRTGLHLPSVVDLQLHWLPPSIGSSTLRICRHDCF